MKRLLAHLNDPRESIQLAVLGNIRRIVDRHVEQMDPESFWVCFNYHALKYTDAISARSKHVLETNSIQDHGYSEADYI